MIFENIDKLSTNWKNILLSIDINDLNSINDFIKKEKEVYEPSVSIFPPENNIFKCFDRIIFFSIWIMGYSKIIICTY